jgi:PAS domain S-box-containing protein
VTVTGYTAAEFAADPYLWFRMVAPEHRELIRESVEQILAGKVIPPFEHRLLRKDGSERWVSHIVIPHRDTSGKLLAYDGVIKDITERKHLEEQFRQAKKMDAIGQLAGGVAHDFNNIIAATMMHLGLLRTNPCLDKDTQNDLKELEVQSNRAATLTRQLLAFGRRSMLDVKVQDMNEIVTNLLKMLRRLIGEDIDVQFNGKGGLPRVAVDTGMMEQVVMNLAVNARDAMPKGGQITIVTQTVEVTAADLVTHLDWKPGRFVCLSVADTGCGMDEETLKRIFEPFFTTKEVGKGTGLGLATVHGIVAQHQGWVDVESVVGQGTTFRIFIPAVQSETAEVDATQLPHPIPGGNETLLLVEDEQTLRRVASLRLRQLGYRVLEVRNGPEALLQWESNGSQVDLLFTDMVMPGGMSGLDLAEQLRKIKPELKVIISSGYSSSLAQLGVRNKAGMVFLPKPYNSEDLAQTVRNCLDGKGCR